MKGKIAVFACCIALLVFGIHMGVAQSGAGVGATTCKGCHEEYYDSYSKSPHGKKAAPGSPATSMECESCHGLATTHMEKGGGKGTGLMGFGKKDDAAAKSEKCLSCHENGRVLTFWSMGAHKKNDVACSDCHSIHKKAKKKEYEGCISCHSSVKAEINKRSHHPIIEGKVKCSNCHNPHGTPATAMIKADTVNELCYTCHAEKRGPFVWEHPPVEENCAICHIPHGSTHTKLHSEKVPNLCQACHDWSRHPGTRYGSEADFTGSSSNRFVARSCLNCHNAIHGSNAPVNPASGYNSGKAFVR